MHQRAKFHHYGFKMWAYSPQNRQKCNFWYKFVPNGKSWRSIEKVEYTLRPEKSAPLSMSKFLQKYITLFNYHLTA